MLLFICINKWNFFHLSRFAFFPLLPGAFHLMESCASLMWCYGFWNNVVDLRPSAATNAWSYSMILYLSSQVSNPTKD